MSPVNSFFKIYCEIKYAADKGVKTHIQQKVTLPLSGRFFIFGHSPSLLDRVLSTHGTTCQSLRFLLATRERVLRVVYT